jgi:hypothetical protein
MLMNYIPLEDGIPKRLHFTDHYYVDREVWDKDLEKMKWIKSLVFWTDEEDGSPTAKTFSVLSNKLAELFRPYLQENRYRTLEFTITKRGEGFGTQFTMETNPWKEQP